MRDLMNFGRLRRYWLVVLSMALLLIIVLYYAMYDRPTPALVNRTSSNKTAPRPKPASRAYSQWPPFELELVSPELFREKCVTTSSNFSIAHLADILSEWRRSVHPNCRELYQKFSAIYTVERRVGSVVIPGTFKAKVQAWLGQREELYQELFHQDIIHVINQYTRETTIFNPLRDKRPVTKPKESEKDYLQRITKESAMNCDFCRFRNFTAEHDFGRVETDLSFSASNIFKLDRLHAVITIKAHDPVNWSYQQYMDMMRLTMVWLKKAHHAEPSAVFPSLIWDLLPKSGSSQLHPHNQIFLSPNRYHGMVEMWRRAAQEYVADFDSNYFTDLVSLYSALELVTTHKSAVALASLTPRKDNEVVVIAPKADDDFFQMIYFVVRAFMDDLKKYSFSLGGGFPSMKTHPGLAEIPAFVRIITRGVMTEIRTDISALELFTATNVNIDPYKVIQVIRQSVKTRAHLL
ncbi:uncharacterized protein LOC101858440 [Aplysia californica]|uniref:Uncharacterized protein LOC101858440 n=1 Tax=Aplysia californica TaxID=6500 RepID=A0ABM0K2M1_APLCA|nr:uncharacterized protein LOC101858440 [Aplysia californica]XP_035828027.1 uncharacterized protein LOC101858440 [Aplysia californica]